MKAAGFSGEPTIAAPGEVSDIGWFKWDSLPSPLFLPLELINQSHPADAILKSGRSLKAKRHPSAFCDKIQYPFYQSSPRQMTQSSNVLQGTLLILLASVIWGTTGTAQTLLPAGVSPLSVGVCAWQSEALPW